MSNGPGRPELTPGDVLLVAVSADRTSVDLCGYGIAPTDSGCTMVLAASASDALDNAIVAVQTTTALRLRPLTQLPTPPPVRLGTVDLSSPDMSSADDTIRVSLAGSSFGLAFFLRAASFSAQVPLRGDIVALAGVNTHGVLQPVGGLAQKVEAIVRWCPAIDHVLVAPEQVALVDACAARLGVSLQVRSARTGAELLSFALVDTPNSAIAAATPTQQHDIAHALFALALDGHGVVSHWRGVASAATAANDAWGASLSPGTRARLQFAAAVAHRHAGSAEHVLPSFEWTADEPGQLRRQVLAHYIQDSTDRGTHLSSMVVGIATAICAPERDLSSADCRVMGAWARRLAVTGHPNDAMRLQRRAARQWIALMQAEQASMPLCEWMRLAGALGDRAAAAEARLCEASLTQSAGLTPANARYLRLARTVMGLRLASDVSQAAEALHGLGRIVADVRCPPHVRFSAARWLIVRGEEADIAAGRATLRDGADHTAAQRVAFRLLAEAGDCDVDANSSPLLSAIRAVTPGIVTHLQAAYGEAALPAALSRWFIY